MWFWILAILAGVWIIDFLKRKLNISNISDKYVFITGCDSGFGRLLAERLDIRGFKVIAACLTTKGMTELKEKCSSRLETVQLNVVNESEILKTVDKIKTILPADKGLWAVVNNAGVAGPVGPIECFSRQDYIDTLNVNLYGVIDVTTACIPLVRKARGRFVNVASIFGRISASPAPYCIAKYGVEAFSDALRREVYHQGMTVHILEPGYFRTDIINVDAITQKMRNAFNKGGDEFKSYYGKEYLQECEKLAVKVNNLANPDITEVVDCYEHAIVSRYPKYRYIIGKYAKYFFRLLWNLPEWMSDAIMTSTTPKPIGATQQ